MDNSWDSRPIVSCLAINLVTFSVFYVWSKAYSLLLMGLWPEEDWPVSFIVIVPEIRVRLKFFYACFGMGWVRCMLAIMAVYGSPDELLSVSSTAFFYKIALLPTAMPFAPITGV